MRNILIAAVTVAGLGLLGTSGAFAAPAAGAVVRDLATASSNAQDVRYCFRRCWHNSHSHRECGWRECRDKK